MSGSVAQEIRRLQLPERGPDKFFEGLGGADQRIADMERLRHENQVLRERNAELEAALAVANSSPRYGDVRSIVEGLKS